MLGDFTRQTGLTVAPRFDTEANKSVGLFEDLTREQDHPRCDVHWNNEILSTIRLQRLGLLEPYDSPAAADYPASAQAKDHSWHAFAARARVLLVNTNLVPARDQPRSILDLLKPRWQGKIAMAKPEFGTTATQAACLFEVLGADEAKRFYQGLRANKVVIVPGNKQVAEGVAEGRFALGLTDTDDAIAEVEAGRPVALIFPDRDAPASSRLGTLFIPNTLALIRGSPNPEGAKKLIDYLLSPEVETKLAEGPSRQIPLNTKVTVKPHPQIETPQTVKAMDVDFEKAAEMWEDVQKFLRDEFARP